ncbi:hypothetical protein LP421_05930 [Rhizobium sp. RCAM05350]|nr:hypothetical protein LP421_05930 [Rhizobium sp. RCAM05350]
MGTVARPSCLPEANRPVKPDCAIRAAARVIQMITALREIIRADPQRDLT